MTGDELLGKGQSWAARISGLLADLAKGYAIVSIPVGVGLIFGYCQSTGAPFPATDLLGGGGLASVVAVVFAFLALSASAVVIIPALVGWQYADYFKKAKRDSKWWRNICPGLKLYGLLLGPWLSLVLSVGSVLIVASISPRKCTSKGVVVFSFLVFFVAFFLIWWACWACLPSNGAPGGEAVWNASSVSFVYSLFPLLAIFFS